MFVGRCQKENAADLREVLVKFLWKMTYIIILYASSSSSPSSLKRDSQVRDCTPTRVKELPGWVADDVIFPIRVVGPSEMGLLPVQVVSNLVMATVMIMANHGVVVAALLVASSLLRCMSNFGFDESDGCSFGSSRRTWSAGSFRALLSCNFCGLLGSGS